MASNGSVAITVPAKPESLSGGERKTITVLFADSRDSMSQIEDLDPEAARAIVDPALAIIAEAVNCYYVALPASMSTDEDVVLGDLTRAALSARNHNVLLGDEIAKRGS